MLADATSSAAAAPGTAGVEPFPFSSATPTTCSSTTRRATSRWCAPVAIIAGRSRRLPGTLEISAGRNIQMLDQVAVLSMGPVVPGDTRPAPASPWGLRGRRLTPASCAATWTRPARRRSVAAADRPGPAVQTYEHELLWLTQVYGFAGNTSDARERCRPSRARVRAPGLLRSSQRRRPRVQKSSPRLGSLRGRQAIAALFPARDRRRNAANIKTQARASACRWPPRSTPARCRRPAPPPARPSAPPRTRRSARRTRRARTSPRSSACRSWALATSPRRARHPARGRGLARAPRPPARRRRAGGGRRSAGRHAAGPAERRGAQGLRPAKSRGAAING